MKNNLLKLLLVVVALIVLGTGVAFAGGYKNRSSCYSRPSYGGAYHGGGGYHQPPYHRPNPGYWHPRPHHYGPPARYYHHPNHTYRGYGRYDGGYYFSGAFAEPGFGIVFGTRGSW